MWFTGNANTGLAMQVLRKTGSVAVHGNPFSDDEGRHDKSPLLIGSVDSSYALDPPYRSSMFFLTLSAVLRMVHKSRLQTFLQEQQATIFVTAFAAFLYAEPKHRISAGARLKQHLTSKG